MSPSSPLEVHVRAFAELLSKGRSLDAMERFYGDDVIVFENRELARAGKKRCLAVERDALAAQPGTPKFRLRRLAVNDAAGYAFLEYVVRYTSREGRPMRLEEVAVQTWEHGKIVEERFYYEGVVDEGDSEQSDVAPDSTAYSEGALSSH